MSISDRVLDILSSSSQFAAKDTLSCEEQERIYTAAHKLYETGAYPKALEFFLQLTHTGPFEEAFWRGQASCYQMLGAWDEALHTWAMCALLKEEDPLPHYHAAECLLSKNEKAEALKALAKARDLSTKEDNQSLLVKIETLEQML